MTVPRHGFRSSPKSFRARLLADTLTATEHASGGACLRLPVSNAAARVLVAALVHTMARRELTLVGSSLDGDYASWIAEQTDFRVRLSNPDVRVSENLASQIDIGKECHSPELLNRSYLIASPPASLHNRHVRRPL